MFYSLLVKKQVQIFSDLQTQNQKRNNLANLSIRRFLKFKKLTLLGIATDKTKPFWIEIYSLILADIKSAS